MVVTTEFSPLLFQSGKIISIRAYKSIERKSLEGREVTLKLCELLLRNCR